MTFYDTIKGIAHESRLREVQSIITAAVDEFVEETEFAIWKAAQAAPLLDILDERFATVLH